MRRRHYTKPLPGHKLTVTWSGEYGEESSSTGECACGWRESCSSQREVRNEYRFHLERERGKDVDERGGNTRDEDGAS